MFGKKKSNSAKLERLYHQYGKLLLNIAYKSLNDRSLAEDAVHETMIRVMKNIHKIDESNESATRGFLAIICQRVSYDIRKKKLNLTSTEEALNDIPDTARSPLNIVIDDESLEKLIDNIKKLPPKYREVILLKYHHEYTYEEMSKLLNVEQATLRKRIERAKVALSKILEGEKKLWEI